MRYLLDTNVVLYLLGGRLAEDLPKGEFFISIVTRLEVLSYPGLSAEDEAAFSSFFEDVVEVGLTESVTASTINFRRKYRLKLPDAIVVATTHVLGATLVTADTQLLKLPGLPTLCPTLNPG